MQVRLHKNATTTPKIRALIQASSEPNTLLAQRFGVGVDTIARWKHRDSTEDRSHTPHRLSTTLNPGQESIVVVLRQTLGLSLDDLLAVTHEFLPPTVTRAALHRLTRPKHPQTNGMVERFNGHIAEILRTHHFRSGEELEATLLRYAWLYNHHLPQKALGHISPVQAMNHWQASTPNLFHQRVVNLPGLDI